MILLCPTIGNEERKVVPVMYFKLITYFIKHSSDYDNDYGALNAPHVQIYKLIGTSVLKYQHAQQ